jgi:hypothetical protein
LFILRKDDKTDPSEEQRKSLQLQSLNHDNL